MFSLSRFSALPGAMLVSLVNTQLRDHFADLADLCRYHDIQASELEAKLAEDGFVYQAELRQFREA
ncbi:DUF4250 domain-containing protein [Pseudaeromonas paramecii]|uniref:DUF4250 domain-containing protein n=1 Tax=Pseudaeromonas paramecii TaxID=2138166 RepID=A0ABP8Q962_9GAMM